MARIAMGVGTTLLLLLATQTVHARTESDTHLRVRSVPLEVGSVPTGAKRVKFLRLRMTASCEGSVDVRSIRVRKLGLGESKHVRRVYLMQRFTRLSRGTRISGDDQTAQLRTRRIRIPACETRDIDVAVDFSATTPSGSQYVFRIDSPEDIVTTATEFEARFPLINGSRASDITPESTGMVTVTFVPVSGRIRTARDEVLSKFRIKADNKAHQMLYSITLTNEGTARDEDVTLLYLTRQGGRPITDTATRLDGDQVTLKFTPPFFLRKGNQLLFEFRGKPARATKTLNFIVRPSDLYAIQARKSREGLRDRGGNGDYNRARRRLN